MATLGGAGADGWVASKIFAGASNGYTYDDVVFLPGHLLPESEVDLSVQLTKNLRLTAPFIGSPLDTVSEANMAIALALLGGIGVIHRNQSAESQVEMVKRVKRHVSGFWLEPATLAPTNTLYDYDRIRERSSVTDVVVTERGLLGEKILGLVSERDADVTEDRGTHLSEVMVKQVIVAREPLALGEAYEQLKKLKMGCLPVVDDQERLVALVSRRDLKVLRDFPRMSRSLAGQLLVGAAVSAEGAQDWERARALAEAGVDVLCIDAQESTGDRTLEMLTRMKEAYPQLEVVAGPAGSCRAAKRLLDAGADAVLAGSGLAATAVFELSYYAKLHYNRPVIAAGLASPRNPGQILKALGLGASAVMLGELLAGADEAPDSGFDASGARRLGPGSASGEATTALRLGHTVQSVPRSLATPVGAKGSVHAILPYLLNAVRNGFADLGVRSVEELHSAVQAGDLRLECRTPCAAAAWEAAAAADRRAAHREVMPVSATTSSVH